ncbi:MAG: thiamine pyrophosphate-dependent dehydrogenase E1 component subunit alpha [Deltaproteobacteria bacterium]|nr:thiamine pyrophosphate-dependent dehydrogenase E1 component subunit alpha [Deltaproteobacteria bacterium]
MKSIGLEMLLSLYRKMVTIRQFETLAGEMFAAGKIPGFIHLSIGQEASSVGVCSVLRPDDYITTTHRGHGHVIAKGGDLKRMFAELMGRKTGYCKGKGGSMHIADFSIGILGANGVVAGGFPIAVGAGLSIKLRKTDQVAVCFFGDGASNRGTFHEALNMAAIWNLPILFVCENNCYASTTRTSYACSITHIATRANGYNIPGLSVDGNDILAVRQAADEAIARARRGEGPALLENKTYRRRGHFEGDPQKYRTQEEVAEWERKNDPLFRFAALLRRRKILTSELENEIKEKVDCELKEAIKFAEESEFPKPEEALDDMFINL